MPFVEPNNSEEQDEQMFKCSHCEQEEDVSIRFESEGGEAYCEDCYYECYRHCCDCGMEVDADYIMFCDRADDYFCESCYPEDEYVDLASFTEISVQPPVEGDAFVLNKFERAVGVEIETIGNHSDFISLLPDFRVTSDGSISDTGDDEGFEFISKPMRGDHLFFEIDNICSHLIDNSFWINRTCGLHIHIDARDLFYEELKGIALVARSFERVIFSMMPKSRNSTNWCKPMQMNKDAIKRIDSNEDFIEKYYDSCGQYPSMDKYNDARYHGLNLHARVYLGTIEFRYHSGTNNPTKIKNWITICQSIVQKGIELGKVMDEAPEDWDSKTNKLMNEGELGLTDFIEILELDDISQYIVGRVRKFNHYTSDTDAQYWANSYIVRL